MENSYQFLEDQLKGDLPDFDEIIESYRQMIISVSGWRKVFSISGDEEDADGRISRADAYLCALIAYVYGSSVDNENDHRSQGRQKYGLYDQRLCGKDPSGAR